MKWSAVALTAMLVAAPLFAAHKRAASPPATIVAPTTACFIPLPTTTPSCTDGATGDAAPPSFDALHPQEVTMVVNAASAALDAGTATIAVVDRIGRPLALFRQTHADPNNDDRAIGVARTAAFFSHNMAPLTSRTVRFISGIHFPPGVTDAPNAALYGIENTNRGCGFNVSFNAGKCIEPAKSLSGGPGPGIVTGKKQPDDSDPASVEAGGIPLYRIIPSGLDRVTSGEIHDGRLVGAIGVVGIAGDPQLNEFAAATGAFAALGSTFGPIAPVPFYPLPEPGNVFIDGIRLPFLGPDLGLTFNSDGLPTGVARPAGTNAGSGAGTFVIPAGSGVCAPNEYLAGPAGGTLSSTVVDGIVQRAIATAKKTRAVIRLPLNSYARMAIAVADVDGSILAIYRMPDATIFSIDVAVAKARNVIWFSSHAAADLPGVPNGTAVTNRTINFGAQPLYPPGIDSHAFKVGPGPFYQLFLNDLANPCTQGSQPANANQNGIVFFAGATPLYQNGTLVGGLGVSGDGIEQDDYVTYFGAGTFLPAQSIWADQVKIDGARLPMFKFPRHPEGVTECGGGPCS